MIINYFFLKELKKYPFFFLLLFFTLLLGVCGLIGIGIVSSQVEHKFDQSAKELLTSDMAISARREFSSSEISLFKSALKDIKKLEYRLIDIYSMVTNVDTKLSKLTEIRSTQREFPFYGRIELENGDFSSEQLYVSKDFADQWKISVGQKLKIGEVTMPVSGIVTKDTSIGLRGVSLAPRIYFPLERLQETGLIRPGATGNFSFHYKSLGTDKIDWKEIKRNVYKLIKDPAIRVTFPQDTSEQTGRVIQIVTNFMALSGLIGLMLSLIGVFYLYQSHLHSRLRDLCLFNLFGIHKNKLVWGLILQFSIIFLCVTVASYGIIHTSSGFLFDLLSKNFGIEIDQSIKLGSSLGQLPLLYALVLFILAPLFLGLTRTHLGIQLKAQKVSLGKFRFLDFIPFILILWVFSCYLARSFKIGNIFFGSLTVVFILSYAIVRSLQLLILKWVHNRSLKNPSLESGLALRSIARSGHKLILSFLSLTLSATLISLILQLDSSITNEISLNQSRPTLFFFDIQEEQLDEFVQMSRENGTPVNYITPLVRARLELVNNKKFIRQKKDSGFSSREDDEENRFRNNGLNLTFRNYLTDSEEIIIGKPFPKDRSGPERLSYVSLEKRWADRMNIEIGDKLTFDIQGVEFQGIVHNIKKIKWTSFYPNFFVTIEPGIIDSAPKTFLATLPKVTKEKKLSIQKLSANNFSNISFIDVELMINKLALLFEKARQAIEVISWLSMLIGLIILYGLSHDQVYRHYYDLALLKSLGLSPAKVKLNLFYEFGSIFFSALGLGLALGWIISQILAQEIFRLDWEIDWTRILYPGAFLTILCLATIYIASWRVVKASPRELLSET